MNCADCKKSLAGQQYVEVHADKYCLKCHEKNFANVCAECKKKIVVGQKDLSYGDEHYHEECFACMICKISLADTEFEVKDKNRYCTNCYVENLGKDNTCPGCKQVLRTGEKKLEYGGDRWHETCFVCNICKKPVGTASFFKKDDKIVCEVCHVEKFAKSCAKCNSPITGSGVTFEDQAYHRDCFLCEGCNGQLAGVSFTKEQGKPYCQDCYAKNFAKKCASCRKVISGPGGQKYVTFEDRAWHNDCFNCTKCKASLVGKGFHTEGLRVLCPKCA